MNTPTLLISLSKSLNLDPTEGKYAIICEETDRVVQFRSKRAIELAIKTGDIYRLDWGL